MLLGRRLLSHLSRYPSITSSLQRFIQPSLITPTVPSCTDVMIDLSFGRSIVQMPTPTAPDMRLWTKITPWTNIRKIRRRKMNRHQYKKRRKLYRRSERTILSRKRRMRPRILKEREQIQNLMEYWQKEKRKIQNK
jgi:hypothetical protein